ncbi:hypothetical protein ACQW5G_03015 [Fructilactobacillus sp. Tb1]|uniref:amino acid kinase family protein n=1 Tax=Fructilactobacillus sp. Tb1 TaxID=3422304 RepID=UPI003D2B8EC2
MVNANPARKVVVVRAIGKCDQYQVKLTDQLIELNELLKQADERAVQVIAEIKAKISAIVAELQLDFDVSELDQLADLRDANLISRGEYFTARLMAEYLDWPLIDARHFLVIHQGNVDYQISKFRLNHLTKDIEHFIVPGFYGVNKDHQIELLTRGGGDTSGAIVANLVNAAKYENWTDTCGIYDADPNEHADAQRYDFLTYTGLQEFADLGLQIYNPAAIKPVQAKQIPIEIRNTNDPNQVGTIIISDAKFHFKLPVQGNNVVKSKSKQKNKKEIAQ